MSSMISQEDPWKVVTKLIQPNNIGIERSVQTKELIKKAVNILLQEDLGECLISWYQLELAKYVTHEVKVQFWHHFRDFKKVLDNQAGKEVVNMSKLSEKVLF